MKSITSLTLASLALASLSFSHPVAQAEEQSGFLPDTFYDSYLNKDIDLDFWLDRPRDFSDIATMPGKQGFSSIKDHIKIGCSDFSLNAPSGWTSSTNSTHGVISVTPRPDTEPGDYEVTVVDSSECFPLDEVEKTINVAVKAPSESYSLDDSGNLIVTYKNGRQENLGDPQHLDTPVGKITEVKSHSNGVVSVATEDGNYHNLYHDYKEVSHQDNHTKGVAEITTNKSNETVIIATDGSQYNLGSVYTERGNKPYSISDLGVVGDGVLYVSGSDGTTHKLGVIRDTVQEGIRSISLSNEGLSATSTKDNRYEIGDSKELLGIDNGVLSARYRDDDQLVIKTANGETSRVGIYSTGSSTKEIAKSSEKQGEFFAMGHKFIPKEDHKDDHDDGLLARIVGFLMS